MQNSAFFAHLQKLFPNEDISCLSGRITDASVDFESRKISDRINLSKSMIDLRGNFVRFPEYSQFLDDLKYSNQHFDSRQSPDFHRRAKSEENRRTTKRVTFSKIRVF